MIVTGGSVTTLTEMTGDDVRLGTTKVVLLATMVLVAVVDSVSVVVGAGGDAMIVVV